MRLNRHPDRNQKGYSLAEVSVVLAIFALGLAVAIPAMSQFMRSYSARVGADEFISRLRLARHLAIARHQPVSVVVGATTYSMPDWTAPDLSTAPSRSWNLPGMSQIVSGTGTVTFRTDGTVSAGSGTIRLEIALDDSYTARYDIGVAVSGKVTSTYTQVTS
ncbi:MAG: GspH/FimT family pseudopilin [Acidobacteriota bacterium]